MLKRELKGQRPAIETWDVLKRELKGQFSPGNASWLARESLKKLKHTDSVRDYVKEFSSLMLDIKNMADEDKLFNFISGLQPWAQTELRRQAARDLPAAIAAADGLVDFRFVNASSESKKSKKGKKGQSSRDAGKKNNGQSKTKQGNPEGKKSSGCFICDGPHRARECPKREKLNALVKETEGESSKVSEAEAAAARMNPLQLLNNTEVEVEEELACILRGEFYQGGLMCAKVKLNGVEMRAMIDTGATVNLVEVNLVPRLGLQVARANLAVALPSHHQVVPNGVAVANLSVGT